MTMMRWFYPTKQFLHRYVRRPSQKERFVQIVAEIQIYQEIFQTTRRLNFDDQMWLVLMNMLNWEERYKYLIEMGKTRELVEREGAEKPISERNREKLEMGEMVYARGFHSIVDIYGSDFRKKIDDAYGCNILKQQQQGVPEFLVDCRYLQDYSVISQARFVRQMQALHDDNWFSSRPMRISFANYRPDQQLAAIARKNLVFQYGPAQGKAFQPHPLAPVLTSRRISQISKKENLLYITNRATRFLPDVLPDHIRGVVYCLSNESSPSTSGESAAINEQIASYRIPFKKFVSSEALPNSIQLVQVSRVMRDWFQGATIRDSILGNVGRVNVTHKSRQEIDSKVKEFRSAMHHINNCSTK